MNGNQAVQGSKPFQKAGAVIVAAGACWGLGISFVGNVHATRDPAARLAMLERHRGLWVAGQFLAAAGTMAVPVGFARFAQSIRSGSGPAKTLAAGAAAALLVGAPLFVVALADRASDLERFAYRRGANWPFLTYSGLHIGGLAALGAGLLLTPLKPWTGITAAASAPVFAAILAGTKDIPPFVFYLVETAVGVQLMRYEEPMAPSEDHTDAHPRR
ncbi:hypothetical protein [Pseudarthrobacter cellobiosi]|uniref:hypothetical protein n=1 Tax=Pseudarthrobacter cellobiosi TaxID=2953654 RepID=UPI00208DF12E|nr:MULTISPECIES: hypothetical protein [unclassified Pseudarthrobacter]MCO4256217.1 hypothetical protein [Pseudarthrobacter sp. HLT1-5]MCO4275775.1 hypothetical protein [Pseudarthrobacter sp. HLT3-5]